MCVAPTPGPDHVVQYAPISSHPLPQQDPLPAAAHRNSAHWARSATQIARDVKASVLSELSVPTLCRKTGGAGRGGAGGEGRAGGARLSKLEALLPPKDSHIQWTHRALDVRHRGKKTETQTLLVTDRTWHGDALGHSHDARHAMRVRRRETRRVELSYSGSVEDGDCGSAREMVAVQAIRAVKEMAFDPTEATHTHRRGGADKHVATRATLSIVRLGTSRVGRRVESERGPDDGE